MNLPKTILVPTDFSDCSNEALRCAVALAKRLDARVYLMHAWSLPITKWEGGWALPAELRAEFEASARKHFDDVWSKLRIELPSVQGLLVQGDPRDEILKAAADIQADLIVIGTHGRHGLSRVLLGSVAEAVVRRAHCDVLTVRGAP